MKMGTKEMRTRLYTQEEYESLSSDMKSFVKLRRRPLLVNVEYKYKNVIHKPENVNYNSVSREEIIKNDKQKAKQISVLSPPTIKKVDIDTIIRVEEKLDLLLDALKIKHGKPNRTNKQNQ